MKNLWDSIKNFFRTEGAKMKDMTFKQKAEYIWEYYRVAIIAVVGCLIAGISLTTTIIKAHAGGEVVFGIGYVNEDVLTEDEANAIAMDFGNYLGLVYGEECVSASSYTVGSESEYGDVLSIILMVDAGAGNVDAAVCEADAIEYFRDTDGGAWMDLRDILSEETLEKFSDQLYYTTDYEGKTFPCAIYLGDSFLFTESSLSLTDPLIAFPIGAKHTDYMDDFVEYVFGE